VESQCRKVRSRAVTCLWCPRSGVSFARPHSRLTEPHSADADFQVLLEFGYPVSLQKVDIFGLVACCDRAAHAVKRLGMICSSRNCVYMHSRNGIILFYEEIYAFIVNFPGNPTSSYLRRCAPMQRLCPPKFNGARRKESRYSELDHAQRRAAEFW